MEIEEVVRRWQVNESQRAIARATGLARETVKKYLVAAGGLGLSATGPPPTERELVELRRLGVVAAHDRARDEAAAGTANSRAQFLVRRERKPVQTFQLVGRAAVEQVEDRRTQQRNCVLRQQLQQRGIAELQGSIGRRYRDAAAHEIQ